MSKAKANATVKYLIEIVLEPPERSLISDNMDLMGKEQEQEEQVPLASKPSRHLK